MPDPEREIQESDSRLLARMMEVGADPRRLWRPEELGAILRHQMSAAVEFDLGTLERGRARKLRTLASAEGLLVRSFADLFDHPHPPLEFLEMTKQFAKASRHHPDSPLPKEVAAVLYFGSIVAAMLRLGRRITRLDDDALRRGLRWLAAQPWLDERSRALFNEGLEFLGTGEGAPA